MTIFFFLFGLIIGSFLNVVVLRLESEETLGGRSRCPKCRETIRWYDNIPVISFLFLRARCRHCGQSISWQYPLVECVTGALFALFGSLAFGLVIGSDMAGWSELIWQLFLVSLLIVISVYDIRNMEIPLILLLIGIGGAIVYAFLASVLGPGFLESGALWQEMLWGGSIAAAILYALVYFSRETWMGMGDVWLAGIAGAAVGLPSLLFLFTTSFFSGALVGCVLLLLQKKGLRSQIPFAPFLAVGTIVTLLVQSVEPYWFTLLLFPSV